MMTRKHFLLLALMFVGSIALTGCTDDNTHNNGQSGDDETSAVDHGTWSIDDRYMDKSVKPGDDFFMYANGTYWKNTQVPINQEGSYENIKGFRPDQIQAFTEKVSKLTDANFQKLRTHLNDINATTAQSKQKYDEMIAQSGLRTAQTREDLWKSFGRLASMGVASCLNLDFFFIGGKIKLYVSYRSPEMFGLSFEEIKKNYESAAARHPSLQTIIRRNPSLLNAMVPLKGDATRSVDQSRRQGLVTMIETMGLNPADCYTIQEYNALSGGDTFTAEIIKKEEERLDALEKMDFETLKTMVNNYVSVDSALISTSAMAEFNTVANIAQAVNPDGYIKPMSTDGAYETLSGNYMEYLRSKLLADQMMNATIKQQMTDVAMEMKAVFKNRIENNEWMSQASKNNAIEKLDNMVFCIGYPDKWVTEALPDLSRSQSTVEDVYILRQARLNLFKALVGKDRSDTDATFNAYISDKEWSLKEFNAFYTNNSNAMFILPCFCLPPLFDNAQNQAFNYAIFSVTGHEMTHGFDTEGAKFNKVGDFGTIWSNEADAQEFNRRAEMLVQCYNRFEMLPDEMPGVMANGKATITENIADLGGAEIAFQAYNSYLAKNGFKGSQLKLQRQRFFRALAENYRTKYNTAFVEIMALGKNEANKIDPHSMDKERINGVLCNMDGWYDAYDIQPGDKLYQAPDKRVRIW